MRKILLPLVFSGMLCALCLVTAPAQAEFAVTYLSANGADTAPCDDPSRPCATFARVIAQTAGGGTVRVLASGRYGAANITRSLSVVGDGTALILGDTISVNAGVADVVTLRGLLLHPAGAGVTFTSGAVLRLENCLIRDAAIGISFVASGASELHMSNCTVADSRAAAVYVDSRAATPDVRLVLDRVRIIRSRGYGLVVNGTAGTGTFNTIIHDSIVAGNLRTGIFATKPNAGGTPLALTIDRALVANNPCGVYASGKDAVVRIGGSVVTGNAAALRADNEATIEAFPSNTVRGNGDDPVEDPPPPAGAPPPPVPCR